MLPEDEQSFGLSAATLAALRSVLAYHPHVEQAIVFGSRAKGTHRGASDIDLTLIGEALTASELLAIEGEIDDLLLPYQVDLSLHAHIEDAALRAHIARVGRPLFESRVPGAPVRRTDT